MCCGKYGKVVVFAAIIRALFCATTTPQLPVVPICVLTVVLTGVSTPPAEADAVSRLLALLLPTPNVYTVGFIILQVLANATTTNEIPSLYVCLQSF